MIVKTRMQDTMALTIQVKLIHCSSKEMSEIHFSVASDKHNYENSYQPLDLDNSEKHRYDEAQVCSINILSTENMYVNTVLLNHMAHNVIFFKMKSTFNLSFV